MLDLSSTLFLYTTEGSSTHETVCVSGISSPVLICSSHIGFHFPICGRPISSLSSSSLVRSFKWRYGRLNVEEEGDMQKDSISISTAPLPFALPKQSSAQNLHYHPLHIRLRVRHHYLWWPVCVIGRCLFICFFSFTAKADLSSTRSLNTTYSPVPW